MKLHVQHTTRRDQQKDPTSHSTPLPQGHTFELMPKTPTAIAIASSKLLELAVKACAWDACVNLPGNSLSLRRHGSVTALRCMLLCHGFHRSDSVYEMASAKPLQCRRRGEQVVDDECTHVHDGSRVAHPGASTAHECAEPHDREVQQHGDRHTEDVANVVDDL